MSELVEQAFSALILEFPNTEVKEALLEIQKQAEIDLFSNTRGQFTNIDKVKILNLASEKLGDQIHLKSPQNFSATMELWGLICSDFHKSYWGVQATQGLYIPIKSDREILLAAQTKKRHKLVVTLIFTMVNSWVIMKGVIYYFGTHRSQDLPNDWKEDVFLYAAIAFSLLFLIRFLIKNKHEDLE